MRNKARDFRFVCPAEALFMFKNNPYLSIKIARPGDLVAVRPELRNSTVSLMGSPTDCRTRSEEADGHYWLACSENVVVYFFFCRAPRALAACSCLLFIRAHTLVVLFCLLSSHIQNPNYILTSHYSLLHMEKRRP